LVKLKGAREPTPAPALDLKISEMPLRAVPQGTDQFPVIAGGVNYRAALTSIVALIPPGSGQTVDTGEAYKTIMLSNGTVRAIPVSAVVPTAPTDVTLFVSMTSVGVSWTVVPGAVRYNIYRDGVLFGTTTDKTLRDVTVVLNNTYEYSVASVDAYGQISPRSDPVSATIDISLNHVPADVVIKCWPLPIPTDGPAFIRVNATEIDVQTISYALSVDAGSLRATNDPSLWILLL
jgi:hypothetical protein